MYDKDLERTRAGIYIIECVVNNKIYIGSATRSFHNRWGKHLSALKNNKHHSPYLQSSFNKYGENNFKFYAVEIITNEEMSAGLVNVREQFWIDTTRCYEKEVGFNTKKNVTSSFGFEKKTKTSNETKQKLSKILIGNKRRLGVPHTEETKQLMKEKVNERSAEWKQTWKITNNEKNSRTWTILFPNGKIEIIKNLNEFCRNNNLDAPTMVNVANGKHSQHKGFKCSRLPV